MSAHTPGPWMWDGNPCDYDHNNEAPWLVTDAYAVGIEKNFRHGVVLKGAIECLNEADARLIAAAPELLAALEAMVDAYWGTTEDENQARSLTDARAVIAKATGSSE